MFWHTVGLAAATLTMFSFVPQIFKIIKTKSAKDVSVLTILQLTLGVCLWLAYGIYLKNSIIILANAVTLVTLAIILFLYFNYGKVKA